jgi:WD40-like Beta Propeller Repeat
MAAASTRARSSVSFDWSMGILAALLMGGLLLDGWAHSHGEVDQSFITPWHALLYGSMGVNGIVLLAAGIAGLRKGYRFRDALPPGYWGSAIGVLIFVLGGGFDAWWHTRFGIETGIALLVSPSHLVLALGAALVMSGPLFSIASQYGRETGGWKRIGPAVLATWSLVTLIGFFLAYAQPIEDGFTPTSIGGPSTGDAIYPMLYVADAKGTLTRIALPPKDDLALVDASPDGRHLVYRVNRYQDLNSQPPSDLVVSNLDGTYAKQITKSGRHDTQPKWSPDGKWIAYVSMPAETSGAFEIHVVSADGKSDSTLLSGDTTINDVTWSPDGRSIAYGSRNGTTGMAGVLDVASKQTRWLPFTANAGTLVWTTSGLAFIGGDGFVRVAAIDGSNLRKIPRKSDGAISLSQDGRLAYLSSDLGSEQVFTANADGSNPRDISQLSGLDAQDATWTRDGRLVFVALGRSTQVHSGAGPALALTALIVEGILLAGGVLLLVRRWNVPIGSIALLLTFFSLAMAAQTDLYLYAVAGLVTGLCVDIAVAILRERLRSGRLYHALGFGVPFVFTSLFLIITVQSSGGQSGWIWNLLLGAPLLAGAAGLFLAYCFDSPLESMTIGVPSPAP